MNIPPIRSAMPGLQGQAQAGFRSSEKRLPRGTDAQERPQCAEDDRFPKRDPVALKRPEIFYTDDFIFDVMGIEEFPTELYQYTSIESLEKILQTRTLRFSRLDKVNDPEEAIAADLPLASSSVFVSCWSNEQKESIPMWSMYGSNFRGVRIRLPANMFAGRRPAMVLEEGGALTIVSGQWTVTREPPAMETRMSAVIGPNKIFYSDDPAYRIRKLVHRMGGTATFCPYDLGMVKGTPWFYEQEWRYKISALSFEAQFPDDEYFNKITLDLGRYPVINESVFVPLDQSAIEEMEVTVGPRADYSAVEAVISKYAPSAWIIKSALAVR